MFQLLKKRRRARLRRQPFPPKWLEIIEQNVSYYRLLTDIEREDLRGLVQVFLGEKNFEGCGGLEITDEIRVTIAAHACILLLRREHDDYSGLKSVVVYPGSFLVKTQVKTQETGPEGVVAEFMEARSGEAWSHGTIILAWDAVRHCASDPEAGHNVVLHEFAHQLDQQDGSFNGAPLLRKASEYVSWARVLRREYRSLSRDVEMDFPTVIDEYGAKDPAEFFAVITECFFTNPVLLRANHPQLYKELKRFYRQDPAARMETHVEEGPRLPESGRQGPQ
ncbi:MAG: zinc-dependent peptidase [Verrucomicrobia bacterium]|nr:zinc-dependent peptidase [Verrucomicrobiota bacterium]